MKRSVILVLSCFFILPITAQNLVVNPSFEEFPNDCPENPVFGAIEGWSRWKITPDVYSACVDPQTYIDSIGWVPWNMGGYQYPADGMSYIGINTDSKIDTLFDQNLLEYMGTELIEALEPGETYYVSFKANRAAGTEHITNWVGNRLGAYFTTQSYHSVDNPLETPNFAHVYEESIIMDTANWVTVSGSFVADQAYTHMALGVFYEFEYLDTLTINNHPEGDAAYYFIDDVCVSRFPICDLSSNVDQIDGNFQFTVFPNPASRELTLNSSEIILEAGLVDLTGKWVIPLKNINQDRLSWSLEHITAGMYIVQVKTALGIKREKIIIRH